MKTSRVAPAPRGAMNTNPSRAEWLRVAFFLAGAVVVAGVFTFTSLMVNRLSEEVATTSGILARLCAQASFPAARDPQLQGILLQVIAQTEFPIIITDDDSLPRAWRQVGVDTAWVSNAAIDSLAMRLPVSPQVAERVEWLQARARALDRKHAPIIMTRPLTRIPLGRLHYGDPPILERLRWMPYVSLGGLLLLFSLGWWGLTGIRRAERRTIWVGMALETAHQLGTPLSSLMGWIELLRARMDPAVQDGGPSHVELTEALDEMDKDVERLTQVAQRFSHVGSAPQLERMDAIPVVRQAVDYMRRRLPREDEAVIIDERYTPAPEVPLNPELIRWVLENLITNAVSALDKRPGRIEIAVTPRESGRGVEIAVRDNGRGMNATEQRRAFEPGYTTKRRGWGLGLALARRVVEEYHGGRLFIRASVPGEGTTIVASLPK